MGVREWDLEWTSTPDERWESDMNDRATKVAEKTEGVTVLSMEGGVDLTSERADNNLVIEADERTAYNLADTISAEIGKYVTVRPFGEG